MKVDGVHFRTIRVDPGDDRKVLIIDQTELPHRFVLRQLATVEQAADAIRKMQVRGAGLIGAAAAYGMYLACCNASETRNERYLDDAAKLLTSTRPTAQNLSWAVERCLRAAEPGRTRSDVRAVQNAVRLEADWIADQDAECCRRIGEHGLEIIREISRHKRGRPVEILTHCNAGWLAFVDYGSATAPVYAAHDEGIPVHVWVDETRPRNQGASLTAWELGHHGIPHDLIVDNVGGHLMQHRMVDLVITGADRVTRTGDVANKIGTYLKALAAADNELPFYVALPSSTFDWNLTDGVSDIPIEQRDPQEVLTVRGVDTGFDRSLPDGGQEIRTVRICPAGTQAVNFGFDVTPARLITGLLTERGICAATERDILRLYPEHSGVST